MGAPPRVLLPSFGVLFFAAPSCGVDGAARGINKVARRGASPPLQTASISAPALRAEAFEDDSAAAARSSVARFVRPFVVTARAAQPWIDVGNRVAFEAVRLRTRLRHLRREKKCTHALVKMVNQRR